MRKTGCRFSGAIKFTQIAQAYLRSRSNTLKSITFMTSMSIYRNIEIEMDVITRNHAMSLLRNIASDEFEMDRFDPNSS